MIRKILKSERDKKTIEANKERKEKVEEGKSDWRNIGKAI